jgi:transposase
MRIADHLRGVFEDDQFAALFARRGQPAESPARLALVTLLQFAENLSDRQAADAVRGRIDWKYALALELTDPGFDHTVLSEFRSRLLAGKSESLLLDTILLRVQDLGLLKKRGRDRTDSTHVVALVRSLNRLERVGETLRAALNELATIAPDWLRALAPPDWYQRYGSRVENYAFPKTEEARAQLSGVIATDGEKLLGRVDAAMEQPWLAHLPSVVILRRVWSEQYTGEPGRLRFRDVKQMASPSELVTSPYDPEARYSTKRDIEWIGYKVHFTETCDQETPHLIVNVETTPATTPDDIMVPVVHESLHKRDLLPSEHIVDKGYTSANVMVDSQKKHGITIVGPVAADPSWQARTEGGLDKSQFQVDWERKVVTCPSGKQSISWLPNTYPDNGIDWEARFARKDCTPCPMRSRCTKSKAEPRIIGLQSREKHEALQEARKKQTTEEFGQQYAPRAGIEATLEQAIRRSDLRCCRYIGLAKTHLQHVLTAAAINLVRLDAWWASVPRAKTRRSRFAALQPETVAA